MPAQAYQSETMKKIAADPLYRDFLDFQEEAKKRNLEAERRFRKEDDADGFRYAASDPYFGGAQLGEAEWGSPWEPGFGSPTT